MNKYEAATLLEQLLEGLHPITGEILPDDHLCNEPKILRALHKAITVLRETEEDSTAPTPSTSRRPRENRANNKKTWSEDEDLYLRNAHAQETSYGEMAQELQRSERNVKYRLIFLGLAPRSILGKGKDSESTHSRMGMPWYPEEDEKLAQLFHHGDPLTKMSSEMGRSVGSILYRLENLGLIEDRRAYNAHASSDTIPL